MKKYLITSCIIALFSIGFAASDEKRNNSPSKSATEMTESVNNSSDTPKESVEVEEDVVSHKSVSQIKNIEFTLTD